MSETAYYIGKDVVHRGCGLILDPERAWKQLPYKTRKNIKKGKRAGFNIMRVRGTPEDMRLPRQVWYYPDDPNIPQELGPEDIMYLAYLNEQLVGAVVLLPVGNHLFLNNLAANGLGKRHQMQSYLLWHCVEELADSQYKYIDVGVSFRKNLYDFFVQWATISYPIIFRPPAVKPVIRVIPFTGFEAACKRGSYEEGESAIKELFGGDPFTFVPNTYWAIQILTTLRVDWQNCTTTFDLSPNCDLALYDLTMVFPVQHGALIRGLHIDDKRMWDEFGCLDVCKRRSIYECLAYYIPRLEENFALRRRNWEHYQSLFVLDDLEGLDTKGHFIPFFTLQHHWYVRYHEKVKEFGVDSVIDHELSAIHLPCHQNLSLDDVEYVYAVFRGMLNLCSEWSPTYNKGEFKER